jgi:hypothetical protein
VAELRAQIVDETARDQKRLNALRHLRYSGESWKDPVIVGSMTRLLGRSQDEGVRMNLCRYLRGADTAEYRQQLLTSTCTDASAGVRREAAQSLRPFASDPAVREILRKALTMERNSGVKEELERTLIAGKR